MLNWELKLHCKCVFLCRTPQHKNSLNLAARPTVFIAVTNTADKIENKFHLFLPRQRENADVTVTR